MEPRMNVYESAVMGAMFKGLVSAYKAAGTGGLPPEIGELVMLRAGQINGCGPCVDIHSKEAAALDVSTTRVNMVAVWRKANCFTDAERAALELAEQGTRIADNPDGVTDEAWDAAARYFDAEQLAALVSTISVINAFNRAHALVKQTGGDYEVGSIR